MCEHINIFIFVFEYIATVDVFVYTNCAKIILPNVERHRLVERVLRNQFIISKKGKMAYDIFEIVPSFRIEGNSAATVSYCSGHIDVVFHFKNGDPAQSVTGPAYQALY